MTARCSTLVVPLQQMCIKQNEACTTPTHVPPQGYHPTIAASVCTAWAAGRVTFNSTCFLRMVLQCLEELPQLGNSCWVLIHHNLLGGQRAELHPLHTGAQHATVTLAGQAALVHTSRLVRWHSTQGLVFSLCVCGCCSFCTAQLVGWCTKQPVSHVSRCQHVSLHCRWCSG
jgi:hypothetical protein